MVTQEILTWLVGGGLVFGFIAFVVAEFIGWRQQVRDSRPLPTVNELIELGFDREVATAAISHLEAECAAGRMRCYRKPVHREGWYVTLENVRADAKPSEYRMELSNWVSAWVWGTLPVPANGKGGAA